VTSRPRNEIPCRDCGLSLWDPEGNGRIYFDCQVGCVPDKTMAVSTARRFVVSDCPMPKECRRHGTGPGTLTVFDIALGRHPDRARSDHAPGTHTEPSGGHSGGPAGLEGDDTGIVTGIPADVAAGIAADTDNGTCGNAGSDTDTGRRPQDGAKARPPDALPADPVSRMLRKRDAERRRKEDQRTLEWCFGRGPSPKGSGGTDGQLS